MGRAPRPRHAGLFHVTARSIAEERIFPSTEDCLDGIGELAALVREDRLVCHQFCLMPTHYHLLVSFRADALVSCVQRFNRRYAGRFNRRHGRRGHVFDSPYAAVPVLDDDHLFNVVPYIARNPVDYRGHPWSSYAGSAGLREPFSFVDDAFLVAAYGSRERLRSAVEAWDPVEPSPDAQPPYLVHRAEGFRPA
jgi:hypothetical protein